MSVDARRILDPYLMNLEGELAGLSPSDRAEIILEIREHFEDAQAELKNPSDSDLRNILERLGPPAEIAAEARLRFNLPGTTSGPHLPPFAERNPAIAKPGRGLEYVAIVLWVVWWPIGVLLTALSPYWTRRDKLIAILFQIVGVIAFTGVFATPAYFGAIGFHSVFLFLALLVFPPKLAGLVGGGYLGWKLVNPGPHDWSESWRRAGYVAGLVVGAWLLWALLVGPLLFILVKR